MAAHPEVVLLRLLNSGVLIPPELMDDAWLVYIRDGANRWAADIVLAYRKEHERPITDAAFETVARVAVLQRAIADERHPWDEAQKADAYATLIAAYEVARDFPLSGDDTPEFWLDRLRRRYVTGEAENLMRQSLSLFENGDEDGALAALIDTGAVLQDVLRDKERERPVTLTEAMHVAWEDYQTAKVTPDTAFGVRTGFVPFDDVTRGLRPGELGIFAARPKVGKSMALNTIAVNAVKDRKRVAVVNIEMNAKDARLRFLSAFTGFPQRDIRFGRLAGTHEDVERLEEEFAQRMERFLVPEEYGLPPDHYGDAVFYPRGMRSIRRVYTEIERRQQEMGWKFDLIVWDYLYITEPDLHPFPKGQQINDKVKLRAAVEQMREVAYLLDAPIWTAHQINREGADSKTKGKPVGVEVLSAADEVGMTADAILRLYKTQEDVEMGTVTVDPIAIRNFSVAPFRMTADYPCTFFYYTGSASDQSFDESAFRDHDEAEVFNA